MLTLNSYGVYGIGTDRNSTEAVIYFFDVGALRSEAVRKRVVEVLLILE